MKKWIKLGLGVLVIGIICILFFKGANRSTPTGITEAYLKAMKAGDYAKAYGYAGLDFDGEAYKNSAELQRNLMKKTYAQMEYEILEETVEENKASVRVTIRNANYISLLDDAIYETLKEAADDAYTEQVFTEALKNAEKNEGTVLVNFRKEEGKWVFDGSNSLLQAAMLGYLDLPGTTEEE